MIEQSPGIAPMPRSRWRRIRVGVATGAVTLAAAASLMRAQSPAASATPTAARAPATPWDSSVALEGRNAFAPARQVLINAYGEQSDFYDVSIRVAWLTLRLREGREAVAHYRRARAMPAGGAEATEGLAMALTLDGYQQLDRGDLPSARRDFDEALALGESSGDARAGLGLTGPLTGYSADLWLAQLSASPGASVAQAIYLAVPVRINPSLSVRGAFRHVGSPRSDSVSVAVFGTQSEFFAGVTFEQGITATELMAFGFSNTLISTTGFAASTRVGGARGATLTASFMSRPGGTNIQVAPSVYAFVTPALSLGAGVRFTSDSGTSATSALVGGSVRLGALRLAAQAHVGTERSAFDIAGPTVLSFFSNTSAGGSVTASYPLGAFTLQAQVQGERLTTATGANGGHYLSFGVGVRWLPDGDTWRTTR